ncbi:MAG: hypothetical protein JWO38_2083 [Gemmataceae bacterium]|nr:hypothetical protein [Gemmataceae bacterium]
MTRYLFLSAVATLALGVSPFAQKAAADWQAYYDQLAKLESGVDKIVDSYPDTIDKLRAGQQKRLENYVDALDKARVAQQVWLSRYSYPGYYLDTYGSGGMPSYSYGYTIPPAVTPSPGGGYRP